LIRSTLRLRQQKVGVTPLSLFPENPAGFPETKLKVCSARPLCVYKIRRHYELLDAIKY